MKYARILLVFALLVFSSSLWATQTGVVIFTEGNVIYQNGYTGSWSTVNVGMSITDETNIKTVSNSVCEIAVGNVVVRLDSEAVYPMDLILDSPEYAEQFISQAITNYRIQNNHSQIAQAAGVRGSRIEGINTNTEVIGFEDDFGMGDPLEDAIFFLEQEPVDYQGVIVSLSSQASLASVPPEDQGRAYFLLGWAYYQTGDMINAIQVLQTSCSVNSDIELQGNSYLFLALSYMNAQRYDEAIQTAQSILDNEQFNGLWEEALSICSTSYSLSGDQTSADNYMDRLSSEYPNSALIVR